MIPSIPGRGVRGVYATAGDDARVPPRSPRGGPISRLIQLWYTSGVGTLARMHTFTSIQRACEYRPSNQCAPPASCGVRSSRWEHAHGRFGMQYCSMGLNNRETPNASLAADRIPCGRTWRDSLMCISGWGEGGTVGSRVARPPKLVGSRVARSLHPKTRQTRHLAGLARSLFICRVSSRWLASGRRPPASGS